MDRLLYLLLGLLPLAADAQTQGLAGLQKASHAIAQEQINTCLQDSQNCVLPADTLATLTEPPVTSGICAASPTPSRSTDADEEQTSVLFIAELRSFGNDSPSFTKNNYTLPQSFSNETTFPEFQNLKTWATEGALSSEQIPSRYVEGMIQITSHQKAVFNSDQNAANALARMINEFSNDEKDKMALLTILSDRLYRNYNKSRNPLNNKEGADVPQGNISVFNMIQAAANWDKTQGGVCNDIAQTVATVAEKVFPDRDVLAINNGSHFGVLINDKHNHRTLVNWNRTTVSDSGEVSLGKEIPTPNTRSPKVINGRLQEIAILDTETGEVISKMFNFNSATPALRSGMEPSILYLELKKDLKKDEALANLSKKFGVAETSQNRMLIFVGQRSKKKGTWSTDSGYAVGAQQSKNTGDQSVIIALHEGVEKKLIHYVKPGITLEVSSGLQLDAQYSHRISDDKTDPLNTIPAFSANAQFVQKVQFETHPKDNKQAQFSGTAMVVHAIGSNDWGARQGAIATPGVNGILKSLQYTNLHLNQVYASGSARVPMSPTLASRTTATYQGSNVGQKIDLTSGIEVQNSGGMKIYAFVGYIDAKLPGYQTNTSLLSGNNGIKTGVTVKTRGGAQFSGQIQGIGGGQGPIGNVNAAIPIFNKKKKK